ncbi:MAG: 2Fe-2S iron-sulfur cluster binding domain-containing protein, partial [Alphaproteobacteria bacterium]|nr:2Fe-2S iron-sulfur cluster binding domain-containing protein [Alphaproteobacteria bacterium]
MIHHDIRVSDTDAHFACASDDTLLRAGLRAGLGLPYECSTGTCGTCRYTLVEGEVDNLWPEATGLNDRDRRKGRMLACQSRPTGDCVVKLNLDQRYVPKIEPEAHAATFVEQRRVTRDISEFHFRTATPAGFLPGQYAVLEIDDVQGQRAYSMSNLANADGRWEFQIKLVDGGAATEYLFDRLGAGQTIGLDGPYGLAYLREDSPHAIIGIAGGSGLSPIYSIA